MDGAMKFPTPRNESVRDYEPGSPELAALRPELARLRSERVELTLTIAGAQRLGGGDPTDVVEPHDHAWVLGTMRQASALDVAAAVDAALAAAPAWRDLRFADRASIVLRAAELLAGPWRATLNAATMLGQSKSVYQAEIDAACEFIDFMRFNVSFGERILSEELLSPTGTQNRFDHRPLEGFVLAIAPFNFTAIAGNLPLAPALMGNTVVWKPSPTQALAAHYTMRLLESAGLPPGVINLVTGDGDAVSKVALTHRDLAGIHFTGSTATFEHLWHTVGTSIGSYRSYPRLVGETGGKNFVIVHPSADEHVPQLCTALIRGAFEYQGQKCSAASRAYISRSIWHALREELIATTEQLSYGDVTDMSYFGGAVIDRRAFDRASRVLGALRVDPACRIVAGGDADDSIGYFVRPTIVECDDPHHEVFVTEYFAPILAVHVFDDSQYDDVVAQAADAAPYALTGAVWANDQAVIDASLAALRYAAGNIYVNDKPTGAVVGQQPFGGARASGTNDKAGSIFNLMRWVSPRVIKETFVPPSDHRYPHMG